jgi:hypothetical protein
MAAVAVRPPRLLLQDGAVGERCFVREGAAAGTVAEMRIDPFIGHRYAAYWRGALYVQCHHAKLISSRGKPPVSGLLAHDPLAWDYPISIYSTNFANGFTLCRLSLSSEKYQIIQPHVSFEPHAW